MIVWILIFENSTLYIDMIQCSEIYSRISARILNIETLLYKRKHLFQLQGQNNTQILEIGLSL